MLKNKKASFYRGQRKKVKNISHVEKILSGLLGTKKILSYKEVENPSRDILSYRIVLGPESFFFLQIMFAKTFHPLGGVELGENKNGRIILLIDPNPYGIIKNKVKDIVLTHIKERIDGTYLENLFYKSIKILINRDREVRGVIKDIEYSKNVEDILKIDFFILLQDGKKIPLQIKSGFFQQKQHRDSFQSPIPSLIYSQQMSLDILKNKILKICKSYLKNIIDHI